MKRLGPNASFRTAILMLLLANFPLMAIALDEKEFDGNWWLSVSIYERRGFLYGYLKCYYTDVKGEDKLYQSWYTYEQIITRSYEKLGKNRKLFVTDILHSLRAEPDERPREGGEVFIFDGEAWRQTLPPERQGFMEGYLWCYTHKVGNPRGTFSKKPAEYVSLVNRWYELDDEKETINWDRAEEEVLTVLFKFIDKTCKSASN